MRIPNIGYRRRKNSSKILVLSLLVRKRKRRKGIIIFSGKGITGELILNLELISGNINQQKGKKAKDSRSRIVLRMVRILESNIFQPKDPVSSTGKELLRNRLSILNVLVFSLEI